MTDIHEQVDRRGVPLLVGVDGVVKSIRLPTKPGTDYQIVQAKVSVKVRLSPYTRGIHMSRIHECLDDYTELPYSGIFRRDLMDNLLERLETPFVSMETAFQFGVILSPNRPNIEHFGVRTLLEVSKVGELPDELDMFTISVPVFTVCPCSQEMSEDRAAHAQRCWLEATVTREHKRIWFEDVIDVLRHSGSAPTWPVLKRPDEKALVDEAFANPKFVEDVVRDAVIGLRSIGAKNCTVRARSQESIHAHDVIASTA